MGRRFPTLFGLLKMPPGTKGFNQLDKDKLFDPNAGSTDVNKLYRERKHVLGDIYAMEVL